MLLYPNNFKDKLVAVSQFIPCNGSPKLDTVLEKQFHTQYKEKGMAFLTSCLLACECSTIYH